MTTTKKGDKNYRIDFARMTLISISCFLRSYSSKKEIPLPLVWSRRTKLKGGEILWTS